MLKADQFWQYAREAVLAACEAKISDDKQGLFDFACAWTQAALLERASSVDQDSPAKTSAA
jgi:hypothetical protein